MDGLKTLFQGRFKWVMLGVIVLVSGLAILAGRKRPAPVPDMVDSLSDLPPATSNGVSRGDLADAIQAAQEKTSAETAQRFDELTGQFSQALEFQSQTIGQSLQEVYSSIGEVQAGFQESLGAQQAEFQQALIDQGTHMQDAITTQQAGFHDSLAAVNSQFQDLQNDLFSFMVQSNTERQQQPQYIVVDSSGGDYYQPPVVLHTTTTATATKAPTQAEKDAAIVATMKTNASKWQGATAAEREQLHAANQKLGAQLGATYQPSTGKWVKDGKVVNL